MGWSYRIITKLEQSPEEILEEFYGWADLTYDVVKKEIGLIRTRAEDKYLRVVIDTNLSENTKGVFHRLAGFIANTDITLSDNELSLKLMAHWLNEHQEDALGKFEHEFWVQRNGIIYIDGARYRDTPSQHLASYLNRPYQEWTAETTFDTE